MNSDAICLILVLACVPVLIFYGLTELLWYIFPHRLIWPITRKIIAVIMTVLLIGSFSSLIYSYSKAYPTYTISEKIKLEESDNIDLIEEQCLKIAKSINPHYKLRESNINIHYDADKDYKKDIYIKFKYNRLNNYEFFGNPFLACEISIHYNNNLIDNLSVYSYDVARDSDWAERWTAPIYKDKGKISDITRFFDKQIKNKYSNLKNPSVNIKARYIFSGNWYATILDGDKHIANFEVISTENHLDFILLE